MKYLKSHFWYTKSQRNGILFLVLLILILQAIYWFVDFSSNDKIEVNSNEIIAFQHQIDSLKAVELENRKPRIYPFNPNYITDFKGYQLGMSVEEIDRLHNYRKQNKWINSVADFKKVTQVSDSLLNKISPYFKFPDWVTKRSQQNRTSGLSFFQKQESYNKQVFTKHYPATTDINKATVEDFKTISGIGEKLSERIIKYRSKLQGFSYDYQLYEVWNISPKVIKKILQTFRVETKPIIKKININTANFKEVLKNPYIDYELCKKIFNYRDEVAELQNISELKNIEGFPQNKYERIILYLSAE